MLRAAQADSVERAGGFPGGSKPRVAALLDPFNGYGFLTCHADVIEWVEQGGDARSEEHTSELQSRFDLVCRLLLQKKDGDFLRFGDCNVDDRRVDRN